jgi:multidrug efflux system membrane fusion protein
MASRLFKTSRVVAVALIVVAGAWIASGHLSGEHDQADAPPPKAAPVTPAQKVSVTPATPEKHARQVVLSCVTQADHRALASSRLAGVIAKLNVDRGSAVRAGDLVAVLSDDGKTAAVTQAQALLDQRTAEYTANKRLIDSGNAPRINLPALEAAVAAAKASLASAQAELDKLNIRAPVDGIVDSVPVQLGQAVQVGAEIAEIVGPDPMLAVGAVTEKQRGFLQVGQDATMRFINGNTFNGTVSFVALSGEKATRTYRVEAKMANPGALIPDGVTCEMSVTLKPVDAAAVPRSALVFSDDGRLGVRIADSNSLAQFVPVEVVDDGRESVWVTGIDTASRVIVVGQDFVKDGDPVEAVSAAKADTKTEPPA